MAVVTAKAGVFVFVMVSDVVVSIGVGDLMSSVTLVDVAEAASRARGCGSGSVCGLGD